VRRAIVFAIALVCLESVILTGQQSVTPAVFTAAQAEAGRTAYALKVSGAKAGTEPLARTNTAVVNSLIP